MRIQRHARTSGEIWGFVFGLIVGATLMLVLLINVLGFHLGA